MEVLQVTHTEDHIVEFTVKLDKTELEKAMHEAAKKVSKDYRLPGFRPGKAPYEVVEKMVGKPALISEVIDMKGDDLYHFGLENVQIEPYTIAEVKDLNTDNDELTVTFVVPKRPIVDLADYRDIRIDFTLEPIEDKQVERGVEMVYQNLALTEGVDRPAEMGDAVVMTLHGFFAKEDGEEHDHEHEHAEGEEHDHEHEHDPHNDEREMYMHEHDYSVILVDNPEYDSVMPGFSQAVLGVSAGEKKSFSLTFGDDKSIVENLRSKTIDFEIEVSKVKARIVLPKKDDFAATLATDGQMNTIEELTAEVRKTLENNIKEVTEDKYLNQVIEKILEGAKISFPQAMLEDYLDRSVEDLDQSLRRRYGLTLDDYLRIMQQSREQVREMRREGAVKDMSTTLALQQVAADEELFLTEEQLDAEIDKHLSQYEAQFREAVRAFYTGETRENFGSRLVSDRVTRRLMDIAKGTNPAKGPDPLEETDTNADASASAEPGPAPDEAVDSTSTDSE